MRRQLYMVTLLILQLALVCKLAPPFARALTSEIAPGLAPSGWPATLQLVATAAAIVGSSLAFTFPLYALARHRQGGELRFHGLPEWSVTLALAGTAILGAGVSAQALVPLLPVDERMTAVLLARPLAIAGIALAAAGVLCAELFRHGIAAAHRSGERERRRPGRIEVTHPPELRTHDRQPTRRPEGRTEIADAGTK